MAEQPTFRELVARALHEFYCVGDPNGVGEPCLGKDHDIEGWTPVAENLKTLMTEAGYRIHRVGTCVHAPVPEGREMTAGEMVAAGLATAVGDPTHGYVGVWEGTCEVPLCERPMEDPIHDVPVEKEFVFGDVP